MRVSPIDSEAAHSLKEEAGEEPSIEEMEALLVASPTDLTLKKDLTYALLDRYLDGTSSKMSGDKNDLKRLRLLVREIPEPVATIPRAYLYYLDKDYNSAIKWIVVSVADLIEDGKLSCDDFIDQIFDRFMDAPANFWASMASAIESELPDSAAVYTIRAWASPDDPDQASSYFQLALDKDPTFWRAAWDLADIYYNEKNWQTAALYYERALTCESAQGYPDLHYDFAWCLGKLRRYADEEVHLRKCLDLDRDFECRNNLGWCLFKQEKYEEALNLFDEAIRLGVDGRYPARNRARALEKLGRLPEAIEAWQNAKRGDKLAKWIQKEIDRLQKLIAQQENVPTANPLQPAVNQPEEEDESDEGDGATAAPIRPPKGVAVQKEELLEESIQKMIERGEPVFGRQLKMYALGRQFGISGIGRIDLLAEDIVSGEIVVIELKRDESHDVVVGQISLYMSWVRENIAKETGQKVVGIICVYAASQKLRLAARGIPGLELFEYELNFARV